jgi:site-specific DNA recombinase
MADTKAGLFEVVLVESLDRLSRDQEDLAGLFKRLSFLGVEILTANDGKADHVSIGVRGLLGALYLKDLADKTRRGLAGKVEAGQSAGGKAYGYRPLPGKPGQLEIVEEEAEIVRRIYREYAAGQTPRSIACDLNRDRIPTPRGAVWNASTINGSRTKGTGICGWICIAG